VTAAGERGQAQISELARQAQAETGETFEITLLASPLSRRYHSQITPRTLRRRMKEIGLRWKPPRHFYAVKDPHRAQKKGVIVRCLKQFWRPGDVLLYEDETIIRLFPPLQACWVLRGAQAGVPSSCTFWLSHFDVKERCGGTRLKVITGASISFINSQRSSFAYILEWLRGSLGSKYPINSYADQRRGN
jgi:hypothetical protein